MSQQDHTAESIQKIKDWVTEYWWLLVLGFSIFICLSLAIYLLWESYYFAMDKAFRFVEYGQEAESAKERADWMFAASGSWGIATINSAIAAGLFSLASIQIGAAALLYSVKQDPVSNIYVIEKQALNNNKTRDLNHKLSKFMDEDE